MPKYFDSDKPKNSEFMANIAEKIKLKQNKKKAN